MAVSVSSARSAFYTALFTASTASQETPPERVARRVDALIIDRDLYEAERVANSFSEHVDVSELDSSYQVIYLCKIVDEWIAEGNLYEAERVAKSIPERTNEGRRCKERDLRRIFDKLVALENLHDAERLFHEMVPEFSLSANLAHSRPDLARLPTECLNAIAYTWVKLGCLGEAVRVAHSSIDPTIRSHIFRHGIIGALIEGNELPEAQQIADIELSGHLQLEAHERIAQARRDRDSDSEIDDTRQFCTIV